MTQKKKGAEESAGASTEAKKPMKVFRIDDVSAAIISRARQVGSEARVFYSVTFSRSYKDSSGQWRYTKWFDLEDLGKVVSVAQQASEYIHSLQAETA